MKYTRFGERERTRLKEEFARPGAVLAHTGARFEGAAGRRSRGERARLDEERVRLEHARSARFLLATAVRLIPRLERARYLEEFRAELLDVPHDTRLWHALSLLRGVFVLRLRHGLKKTAGEAAVRRAKD